MEKSSEGYLNFLLEKYKITQRMAQVFHGRVCSWRFGSEKDCEITSLWILRSIFEGDSGVGFDERR